MSIGQVIFSYCTFKGLSETSAGTVVSIILIGLSAFLTGLNIELEHGTINPETNVTNDDLEMTAKIALAHLNELPNYYNADYGLLAFEQMLKDRL